MPEGPVTLQMCPREAKVMRDTLDDFLKAAEAQGFPIPVRD